MGRSERSSCLPKHFGHTGEALGRKLRRGDLERLRGDADLLCLGEAERFRRDRDLRYQWRELRAGCGGGEEERDGGR